MKISGQVLGGRVTKAITLVRPGAEPLNLTIQALPLGFEETVLERLPNPRPARIYAMKGGKVLKDAQGREVERFDTDNPTFIRSSRNMSFLQAIAFVHEALKADKNVTWDTQEAADKSAVGWEAFYTSLREEMKAANITSGDVKKLMNATLVLSGVKDGDLAAARERFLPEDAPDQEETTSPV